MKYDFANLSSTDFEDLARDLIGRELGLRFEAFTPGADDGMDGRHVKSDGSIILQAKHYVHSEFSALKSRMLRERASIDLLKPKRYILATSRRLTPSNKKELKKIIGPSLQTEGDILGPDELNGLLRAYPEIEKAHQKLWMPNTPVLKEVLASVLERASSPAIPQPLADLLSADPQAPLRQGPTEEIVTADRDVIFLIKASPRDDEFALWLAPKLEAEGYKVFADMLTLEPGDRWRREITAALQNRATKVLIFCRDSTLADAGVQDDIAIANDLAESLRDSRFLIPLRLEPHKKVRGLGDKVSVDFVRGWGEGLSLLLGTLRRQRVPCDKNKARIHPNWEIFRRRGAIPIKDEPERLTSNWLRVSEVPDSIRYFEASGAASNRLTQGALSEVGYPVETHGPGFFSFASWDEVNASLSSAGRFIVRHEIPLLDFVEKGYPKLSLPQQAASNMTNTMFKQAWVAYCRKRGFIECEYSNGFGFHVSADQAAIGQRVPWGKQGERRSSMLRNAAKGYIWQFGVTAIPYFWPFYHFKLKSRVLFAADNMTPTGLAINDAKKQHRLRRSVCKGWRNKQWHGRMLALLELLSGESAYIRLPLAENTFVVVDAEPMLFTSPVSTNLPNSLGNDDEETDLSTLGRPEPDEVE